LEVTENSEGFVLSRADKTQVLEVKWSPDHRPRSVTAAKTTTIFRYDENQRLTEIEVLRDGERITYGFDYDKSDLVCAFRSNDKIVDRFTWKPSTDDLPRWKRGRVAAAALLRDSKGEYTLEVKNEGNWVEHRSGLKRESKLFRRPEL
jgi:YD repeat-containing protein